MRSDNGLLAAAVVFAAILLATIVVGLLVGVPPIPPIVPGVRPL